MQTKKFIIITSINEKTPAVSAFERLEGWRALVEDGCGRRREVATDLVAPVRLGEALLAPTTLYVKAAVAAMNDLNALAHITGGGLTENLPRVLPEGLGADIELNAWKPLPVFKWLAEQGGLDEAELVGFKPTLVYLDEHNFVTHTGDSIAVQVA